MAGAYERHVFIIVEKRDTLSQYKIGDTLSCVYRLMSIRSMLYYVVFSDVMWV
jgi:hypothetical protein